MEPAKMIETEFRIYSVPEVAKLLGSKERTVFRLIKEGELKSIKVRSLVRVLHDDLVDYLTNAHANK